MISRVFLPDFSSPTSVSSREQGRLCVYRKLEEIIFVRLAVSERKIAALTQRGRGTHGAKTGAESYIEGTEVL